VPIAIFLLVLVAILVIPVVIIRILEFGKSPIVRDSCGSRPIAKHLGY